MTDAGWAEKKAENRAHTEPNKLRSVHVSLVAKLLKAEHARSVRIVKALEKAAKLDKHTMNELTKAGFLLATKQIKAALQRGRGGKG